MLNAGAVGRSVRADPSARDRVVSSLCPRVAAHDPRRCEEGTAHEAVAREGQGGVLGTGRGEPTAGGEDGGHAPLIRAHERDQDGGQSKGFPRQSGKIRHSIRCRATSAAVSPTSAHGVGGAAQRDRDGTSEIARVCCTRSVTRHEDEGLNPEQALAAQSKRFPKDPLRAVSLDRSSNVSSRQERHCRRSRAGEVAHPEVRRPHYLSALDRQLQSPPAPDRAVSPQLARRQPTTYRVVKRLRPFARRRASTLRPPGVELRFRNPCFVLPFRFFG